MNIVLDERDHTYTIDGVKAPAVTRVMEPITDFSRIPSDVLLRAQEEGTAIHKMVEYFEAGTLNLATLPEWLVPRLDAWVDFKRSTGYESVYSEERIGDKAFGYAGTLDQFGYWRYRKSQATPVLIDLKRTTRRAAGVQLAAYRNGLVATGKIDARLGAVTDRYALNLEADGTFKLTPFTDPDDWRCFVGLLALYKWKEKNS